MPGMEGEGGEGGMDDQVREAILVNHPNVE